METKIEKAIEISTKASLKNAINKFNKLDVELKNREYKVAVIGEFKTGKSTLINSMFIGKEILYVSHLEATAIPTEVKYGETPVLKVFPKSNNKFESSHPEIFDNPTPAILKEKTAGETASEKQLIINSTSYAELSYKNENLRGLTIIDTPGINSNTQGIIDSVKLSIQDADLILFVKRAKQFSNVELDFLKNDVFNAGVWRGAVLINDDPRYADLDDDEKKEMIRILKAQLLEIGRSHIDIRFIDFKNPVASDSFDEIFGSDTEDQTASTAAQSLVKYLNSNKTIGRNIRLNNKFNACVNEAISECDIELEAMKLSPEELEEAKKKLAEQMNSFADSYDKIEKEFIADLEKIQDDLKTEIFEELNEYRNNITQKLDNSDSITELQQVAEDLSETSASHVRSILSNGIKKSELKILALKTKYEGEIEDSFRKYSSSAVGIEKAVFDPGFFKNLSEKMVTILDYLLTTIIFPFPAIFEIIVRWLKPKWLPSPKDFIEGLTRHQFKSNVEEFFKKVKKEVTIALNKSMDKAKIDIHEGFATTIDDKRDTISAAIETVRDPARVEILKSAKIELDTFVK